MLKWNTGSLWNIRNPEGTEDVDDAYVLEILLAKVVVFVIIKNFLKY